METSYPPGMRMKHWMGGVLLLGCGAAGSSSRTTENTEAEPATVETVEESDDASEAPVALEQPVAAELVCELARPWVRDGDEWVLEPDVRFRVDHAELTRETVEALTQGLSLLSEQQPLHVFLDTHPDVLRRYAVRGLHLPRRRVQVLEEFLSTRDSVEAALREVDTERPNGPPTVRFSLPGCESEQP